MALMKPDKTEDPAPPARRQERAGQPAQQPAPVREENDDKRRQLLVDRPHDFIERTRPEDRLPPEISRGQITRDNINPNIPSAEPGQGPIVDPNTLGMEGVGGGVEAPTQQETSPGETPHGTGSLASINEPEGSTVGSLNPGGPGGPPAPGGEGETELPDLLDLDPDIATIGDADLTLTCTGEGFTADSVITFNGGDEPTTYVSDTTLTTIVKPSLATVAGEFPVTVKNAAGESEPLMFEFVEPARAATAKARPKKPAKAPKRKK